MKTTLATPQPGQTLALALVLGACLLFASRAQAQTFSNGTFSTDSVLDLAGAGGSEVYGVALDGTTSTFTTSNGYTFLGSGLSVAQTDITNDNTGSGPFTGFLNDDRAGVTTTTGDAGFDSVLNKSYYGGSITYTLNGLTSGQKYKVLLFAADVRFSSGDNIFILDDGSSSSSYQQFVFPGGLTPSAPNQAEGGYILDSFTASGTTHAIEVNANQEDQGILLVKVVPEPTTWALLLGGMGALAVYQLRRRSA